MVHLTKLFIFLITIGAYAQDYKDSTITYTGSWNMSESCKCAYSNNPGDRIDYSFLIDRKSTLYVIGEKMATHGIAKITVDTNEYVIDLYSKTVKSPDTVLTSILPVGQHSISIQVTGQKNDSATNNQIVFKKFLIIPEERDVSPTLFQSLFTGKYLSIIKDDTVYVYTQDKELVAKYSYDTKLMMDLRVISRNQNQLELWMIIGFSLMILGFVIVLVRK